MSASDKLVTDDRASDTDPERLRLAVDTLVAVLARFLRAQLTAGEHPLDVLETGQAWLEQWQMGIEGRSYQSPRLFATRVERALAPAVSLAGAGVVWLWLLARNRGLGGRTPMCALAAHDVEGVAAAAEHDFKRSQRASGEREESEVVPKYPRLTLAEYHRLTELVLGPVELSDGHVTVAGFDLVFSPQQERIAAANGIRVWGCLDALADAQTRAPAASALTSDPPSEPDGPDESGEA